MLTGTFFGLYKNMINRKKVSLKQKEIQAENDMQVDSFVNKNDIKNEKNSSDFIATSIKKVQIENNDSKSVDKNLEELVDDIAQTQETIIINDNNSDKDFFPFDDPFE